MTEYTFDNLNIALKCNPKMRFVEEDDDTMYSTINYLYVIKDYDFYLNIKVSIYKEKKLIDILYAETYHKNDYKNLNELDYDFISEEEKKMRAMEHELFMRLVKKEFGL